MSINPNFRDHINFRDLGGYKSRDGRKIKSGKIFRSGGIYLMNQEEIHALLSLGVGYIMDLRTSIESDADPDPIIPGIEMIRYSGLVFRGGEEIDFSSKGMNKIGEPGLNQISVLRDYYMEMPFDNEAFRILMDKLRHGNAPFVFHCATGKDRTGVAAMIILIALGVPEETVLSDYLLSNEFHKANIEKSLADNESEILAHPELEELLRMKNGVTEHIGSCVLEEMKSRHGSLEEYLKREFNLYGHSLEEFRNLYLTS